MTVLKVPKNDFYGMRKRVCPICSCHLCVLKQSAVLFVSSHPVTWPSARCNCNFIKAKAQQLMGASCFSACYKPRKPVTDREKQMRRKYLYELIVPDQRTHPLVLISRFRHAKPPQRSSELLFYQLSNGPGRSHSSELL